MAVSNQRESERVQKGNTKKFAAFTKLAAVFNFEYAGAHHVKDPDSFSASATHLHWNVFLASQKVAC